MKARFTLLIRGKLADGHHVQQFPKFRQGRHAMPGPDAQDAIMHDRFSMDP
ncbi:hypothetical protein [Bordetella genomosp. 10]|uniref:hypothetical protein n=1 Tax=Bordetella genomosp. 10 TaxID=1416804 RepID=UPI002796065F|nr:hypothetical protein [Bordetella genomosp. 10]